ncbi:MAG: Na(+)-translocating NADH-quinone reductase subunit A [Marinilabiliales bacterium]|nr:MAG: Na(+)-translocating NADH-quinone reductase subunit A [Marinilabiliales bacterium]
MSKVIRLRKGLNIPLKGKAEKVLVNPGLPDKFAVKPGDFPGIRPKMLVKPDDEVKAGTPLFFDKYNPDVMFTSPVSGRVVAVNRGERRKILEVVIKHSGSMDHEEFEKADPASLDRDAITKLLLKSGLWPMFRQRPYGIIPRPGDRPRSIFISGFDTAPLAPDYDFVMQDSGNEFRKGIDVIKKLTEGKVYLSLNADYPPSDVFAGIDGLEVNYFSGPHPSGNVGVHIHHLDPVHKNGRVWYINPQDVLVLGRLFMNGIVDFSRIVALTGSEVVKPRYFRSVMGASVDILVRDNLIEGNNRFISGNVLTGSRIPSDGFIGFYDSQVTVIPEGNHYRFMGWAEPGFDRFSSSRTFFSWLMPGRKYRHDTNYNGGERAYVITGEYEKVLPMDIIPQQLVKAIMVEDIDKMENLGIYELVEEDLALCEYVCTSKIEVQTLLRRGIELMIKETS